MQPEFSQERPQDSFAQSRAAENAYPAQPTQTEQPPQPPVAEAQPPEEVDDDEYTYIKTDTGYERVKTSWLEDRIRNQRGPGNAQNAPVAPEEEREYWVHLANGDTVTLKDSDLPGHAGSNALHGFHTPEGEDNAVQIIGVYPK